jgi:hypothetical protein
MAEDDEFPRGMRRATISIERLRPETELLTNMLRRTKRILTPSTVEIEPIRDLDQVKICLISRPLRWEADGPDEPNVVPLERNRFLRGLKHKPSALGNTRASFLADLEVAGKANAQVVCFGEGAFPWEHESDEIAEHRRKQKNIRGSDLRVLEQVKARNVEFMDSIQSLVDSYKMLVIAGSAHDWDCAYVARVFTPKKKPIPHLKIYPSLAMGEKLPPRLDTNFVVCDAGEYYIVVLICMDAYAPATAMRCALMAVQDADTIEPRKPVKYIFVPSLNDKGSPAVRDACKDLSQLCDCVVSYVNCQLQEPRFSVFSSGYPVDDHAQPDILLAHTFRLETVTLDTKGALYTIPMDTVRQLRERNGLLDGHVLRSAIREAASDRVLVGRI